MTGPHPIEINDYDKIARSVRKEVLGLISGAKAPHIGSSFSVIDILVAHYFKILYLYMTEPWSLRRI